MDGASGFNRQDFENWLKVRNPGQPEFRQAVLELMHDVEPLLQAQDGCRRHSVMERLTEPDRIISFRVTWVDDAGVVRVNRGWRVQHCGAIGP